MRGLSPPAACMAHESVYSTLPPKWSRLVCLVPKPIYPFSYPFSATLLLYLRLELSLPFSLDKKRCNTSSFSRWWDCGMVSALAWGEGASWAMREADMLPRNRLNFGEWAKKRTRRRCLIMRVWSSFGKRSGNFLFVSRLEDLASSLTLTVHN